MYIYNTLIWLCTTSATQPFIRPSLFVLDLWVVAFFLLTCHVQHMVVYAIFQKLYLKRVIFRRQLKAKTDERLLQYVLV